MRNVSNKKMQSSFEKKFITKSTFKRNKRYFDLNQITTLQNSRLVSHRKPFPSKNSTQTKIKSSFMNTTGILSDRPQNNSSAKQRKSLDLTLVQNQTTMLFHQDTNPQDTYRPKTALQSKTSRKTDRNNIKLNRGLSMDKMTSRQYYFILKNKPSNDQRLFNNYELVKPKTTRTRGFEKQLNRSLDFAHHHITDINHDSQKQYQYAMYDVATNKCLVNYKTQDKSKGRYYFRSQRSENLPATNLDFNKVQKAYQHGSVTGVATSIPFYNNSGRELPHQIERRQMTPLLDFWHKQGDISRPILDYGLRKLKKDMLEQRICNIKERKKVKFDRQELCDAKYFQVLGIRRPKKTSKKDV